jgi:hypothetical protein
MIKGKIIICEKNKEEIETLLNQVQGKSYVRCFTVDDLVALAKKAELKLDKLQVALKYREGTWVHYSIPANKHAKKWSEQTSEIKIQRDKKHWFLIEIKRVPRTGDWQYNNLHLTESAIAYLVKCLRHIKLGE